MDCTDKKCPIHGTLKLRGRGFQGVVLEAKAQKTATVGWDRRHHSPKYERYERRRTKIKAHNPACINAEKGELVAVQECRSLSKTKHFVITKKLGRDVLFAEKEKLLEESKKRARKAPEKAEEKDEGIESKNN